jgi:hypothetical protein
MDRAVLHGIPVRFHTGGYAGGDLTSAVLGTIEAGFNGGQARRTAPSGGASGACEAPPPTLRIAPA